MHPIDLPQRLYDTVFTPLGIPIGESVVLGAAGWLHRFPLGVALNREMGRYAIDEYLISVAPGLGALSIAHQERQKHTPAIEEHTLIMIHPGECKRLTYLTILQPAADDVAACFAQTTKIYDREALPNHVIKNVSISMLLHFYCHGSHAEQQERLMTRLRLIVVILGISQVFTLEVACAMGEWIGVFHTCGEGNEFPSFILQVIVLMIVSLFL